MTKARALIRHGSVFAIATLAVPLLMAGCATAATQTSPTTQTSKTAVAGGAGDLEGGWHG